MELHLKGRVVRYTWGHVNCVGIIERSVLVVIDEDPVDTTPDSFVCPRIIGTSRWQLLQFTMGHEDL